jgi:hypothetical protein
VSRAGRNRAELDVEVAERLSAKVADFKLRLYASGLTMEAIARLANRSPSTVSTWLKGDRVPKRDVVASLLEAVDAPPEEAARWQREFERAATGETPRSWLAGRRVTALLVAGGTAVGGLAGGLLQHALDGPETAAPAAPRTAIPPAPDVGRTGPVPTGPVPATVVAPAPAYAAPWEDGRQVDLYARGRRVEVQCQTSITVVANWRDDASTASVRYLRLTDGTWVRERHASVDHPVPICARPPEVVP